MLWCQAGDKPLPEPMMTMFHVIGLQWVEPMIAQSTDLHRHYSSHEELILSHCPEIYLSSFEGVIWQHILMIDILSVYSEIALRWILQYFTED